jgi:hypothetical protein
MRRFIASPSKSDVYLNNTQKSTLAPNKTPRVIITMIHLLMLFNDIMRIIQETQLVGKVNNYM